MLSENRINHIICEELTKAEVSKIVSDKIRSEYGSRDFDKAVREISADVVDKLFKVLWQRSSTWKSTLSRK